MATCQGIVLGQSNARICNFRFTNTSSALYRRFNASASRERATMIDGGNRPIYKRQLTLQAAASAVQGTIEREPSALAATTTWNLEVQLSADYTADDIGKPALEITLVAADKAGQYTLPINTATFDATPWTLPFTVNEFERIGVILSGKVEAPEGFGTPGAMIVTKMRGENPTINRVFVDKLSARPEGGDQASAVHFLGNSWVHDDAGQRVFFTGMPLLPSQTPEGLKDLRAKELTDIQGPADDNTERKIPDRIYAYDVYNDMQGPDPEKNKDDQRPILGKARGGTLAYPRRLRTGRPLDSLNNETHPPSGATPWLPLDEYFTASKQDTFSGSTTYAVGNAATSVIRQLFDAKPEVTKFASMGSVDRLYNRRTAVPEEKAAVTDKIKEVESPFDFSPDAIRNAYLNIPQFLRDTLAKQFEFIHEHNPGANKDKTSKLSASINEFLTGLVASWDPPGVRDQRKVTWQTDEELGRQTVAGINPLTIRLAGEDWLKATSVKEQHLKGALEGMTIQQAIDAKRLFWQDYHSVLYDDIVPHVKDYPGTGYQYGGRGLFFARENGSLPVVAIELQGAEDAEPRVFTPFNCRPEIWQVAKAVHSSLDFAVHQLVSHFLQCHACMESFCIATRRQLSAMHPVFQLMKPHYRFTFNINANARGTLANAHGLLEKLFTPGPLNMVFSSKVYEKLWRFDTQALPADLMARGLAVEEGSELKLVLKDFPFAEDGLLIWNGLVDYFTEYLHLYYSDNGQDGKPKVTEDEELKAWYREVREVGHADKEEGWIELTDIASLVRILATVAWTASGHHAAVNFGQYEYAGYMPNKSAFVAARIPDEGSDAEKALLNDFEFQYLEVLADPVRTVQTMLVARLLSNHSKDEEYLSETSSPWLTDPKAKEVHAKFVKAMEEAEEVMIKRNEDAASRTRSLPAGMEYTLLYPSTKTRDITPQNRGMTGRGVPTSVSI